MKKRVKSLSKLGQSRGQIWVETVVYTLIAFALIGLVLTFAKPKIEEIRDKGIIDQSITVLNDIDLIIKTLGGPGNQRVIELGINKGTLNIDGENDKIFFEIESKYTYSQPGEDVSVGNIIARTEEKGNINELTLTIDYGGGYDITFQNQDELKKISKASTPYKVIIKNMGEDAFKKTIVNIEVIN